jgi:hypothetical protein
MHKKCITNIYVEFNGASNRKTIIFYFCKSIEHGLIKGSFFDFSKYDSNSSVLYLLKYKKSYLDTF